MTKEEMVYRHKDGGEGEMNWVGKTVENNLKLIWTHQMVGNLRVQTCVCFATSMFIRICVYCRYLHVFEHFELLGEIGTSGVCTAWKFYSQ